MRPLVLVGALLLCGVLCGCSIQTLHAPKGPLTLTADFTDVQNLVPGHSVKIADVPVGSVTKIDLVGSGSGYRSRVTMSIKKGIRLPVGTSAKVTVTSLLGENYVQLEPPPGQNLAQGPFLANHAMITLTSASPGFEDIIGGASPLIAALAGGDVPGLVQSASTALAGRGAEIHTMIENAGSVLDAFGEHRRELASAIDDLAVLGKRLAAHQTSLDQLPGRLATATKLLADDRAKILAAVRSLSDLAKSVNDNVLVGHTHQIRRLIEQVGPTFAVLASDKTKLSTLISNIQEFVQRMPRQVYNGQLLTYPVLEFDGATYNGNGAPRTPTKLADLVRLLGPRS